MKGIFMSFVHAPTCIILKYANYIYIIFCTKKLTQKYTR